MSGIALIIPNADFSKSPLGKVTTLLTPADIVDAYLARVNAGDEQRSKLIKLYSRLDKLGVLNSIDIFPMLGDTLDARCYSLRPSGWRFNKLLVGANAEINDTGGIHFNDVSPNLSGTEDEFVECMEESTITTYIFTAGTPLRGGTGYMVDYPIGASKGGGDLQVRTFVKSSNAYMDITVGKTKENWADITLSVGDTRLYSMYASNNGFTKYIGETDLATVLNTEPALSSAQPIWLNNIVGARLNDPSTHYFNADLKFYAVGQIEDSSIISDVNAAFAEYFA